MTQKQRPTGRALIQSSHHEIYNCLCQLRLEWGDVQVDNELSSTLGGWLEGGTRDRWFDRNQVLIRAAQGWGQTRDGTTDRVAVLQTEKYSCHGAELQRRGVGRWRMCGS